MTAWIRHSTTGKALFAVALLLGVLLRVAIPTGFMPTSSATGVAIMLCAPGQPGQMIHLDLGKTRSAPEKQGSDTLPCPFAAGLGGMVGHDPVPDDGPVWFYDGPTPIGEAGVGLATLPLAAPPPPAQAPPARG